MRWFVLIPIGGCMEYQPAGSVDDGVPTIEETGPPAPGDVPPGYRLEGFDLPSESTIDVIVFGDTSGSMEEELRTLGETITPFVQRLAASVDDWQLASINGDDGCAVDQIFDETVPDFADRFADAITEEPDDEDSDETGLYNIGMAVWQSRPGGCNEGLVRGGLLHLIFVTDENDESPGYLTGPTYWRDYWEQIVQFHGNEFMVTMSAVAGPTPLGCEGADPGFGYDQAVNQTSGEFLSICDDWASKIDLLADAGVYRDTFVLADEPVPTSIQVWLNEREVSSVDRWHYDAPKNAVVFDRDPPEAGQTVDILYEIAE